MLRLLFFILVALGLVTAFKRSLPVKMQEAVTQLEATVTSLRAERSPDETIASMKNVVGTNLHSPDETLSNADKATMRAVDSIESDNASAPVRLKDLSSRDEEHR